MGSLERNAGRQTGRVSVIAALAVMVRRALGRRRIRQALPPCLPRGAVDCKDLVQQQGGSSLQSRLARTLARCMATRVPTAASRQDCPRCRGGPDGRSGWEEAEASGLRMPPRRGRPRHPRLPLASEARCCRDSAVVTSMDPLGSAHAWSCQKRNEHDDDWNEGRRQARGDVGGLPLTSGAAEDIGREAEPWPMDGLAQPNEACWPAPVGTRGHVLAAVARPLLGIVSRITRRALLSRAADFGGRLFFGGGERMGGREREVREAAARAAGRYCSNTRHRAPFRPGQGWTRGDFCRSPHIPEEYSKKKSLFCFCSPAVDVSYGSCSLPDGCPSVSVSASSSLKTWAQKQGCVPRQQRQGRRRHGRAPWLAPVKRRLAWPCRSFLLPAHTARFPCWSSCSATW